MIANLTFNLLNTRLSFEYLLLEARDEVTTVPAFAAGGDPSPAAKLLRGVEHKLDISDMSDKALPRLPDKQMQSVNLIVFILMCIS